MTLQNNKAQYSLSVHASTEYLAQVRNFVAEHALQFGFEANVVDDIRLAVDEAFTNIIKHAYNNDERQVVEIVVDYKGNTFGISLFDSGHTFSVADYQRPNIKKRIKCRKRGGVGVYLIKKLMDTVNYQCKGRINEIRMTKKR